MHEERLPGGNLSDTTRLGDTVRRNAGPWTPTIHALLRHLDARGFGAAPRPIGVDGDREVLQFIDGDTPMGWPDPFPDWVFARPSLEVATRLLRRFHDLSTAFDPPPGTGWQVALPSRHEVICHNDWAPYNAVFRDERPIAMLDWDMAAPGSRIWDVARLAYIWVPIATPHQRFPLHEQARRLRLVCDVYGLERRDDVIATMREQLCFWADYFERQAAAGHPGFAKLVSWGVPAGHRADADRLRGHEDMFTRAIR